MENVHRPVLLVLVGASLIAQPAIVPGRASARIGSQAGRAEARPLQGAVPPPVFTDPERLQKLKAAFPEIDRALATFAEGRHIPGFAYGIVVDGDLVWTGAHGFSDLAGRVPVDADTVFRIASMTKSFTALAILKLRDEGRLSLEDPVATWVPELASLAYPTRDSPPLTVRHLLTHSEGFPEDNPWGDRQLAITEDTFSAWMREGIPFSNVPGVAYEYSNYGFAILGRIVSRAAGVAYGEYMRDAILRPLGMTSTFWEANAVPPTRLAMGYRWHDGDWQAEPPLSHGAFGAMGGLLTSTRDLARYVGFLLSAWPPRDEPEEGPVRRASLREMQQVWRITPATVSRARVDSPLRLVAGGYGYGLRITQDCTVSVSVSHGGGLPGYGSLMRWLPDHGVGLVVMGNLTYAGWSRVLDEAVGALARTGGLQPRRVRPSPALVRAQADVSRLVQRWDSRLAREIAADNLFLDQPEAERRRQLDHLAARHGACRPNASIEAVNALRGSWTMPCERGELRVSVTLAPTSPPRVQWMSIDGSMPLDEATAAAWARITALAGRWDAAATAGMAAPGADLDAWRRQLEAIATLWGSCHAGPSHGGESTAMSVVRLSCERGTLIGTMERDSEGRVTDLSFRPAAGDVCVP